MATEENSVGFEYAAAQVKFFDICGRHVTFFGIPLLSVFGF